MNQRKANFTVLIVFALACRSATAQDDLKRATRILKPNVDHAVVGTKSLRFDAYLSAGKVLAPAIVLLHGGGFIGGAKGGYTG